MPASARAASEPLQPARRCPPARPGHPQLGAADRPVQAVGELVLVGGRRPAGERRPRVGQAASGIAGERAHARVDLRALDRRWPRQGRADVLPWRVAEPESLERVRAQMPQPGHPRQPGGERAAAAVRGPSGGLDGREARRRAEGGQQLRAIAAADAGGLPRARRGGELARRDVHVGAEAGERRLAAGDAILQRGAQRLETVAGARRCGEHGDVAEALCGEQPRQVLRAPARRARRAGRSG